MGILTPDWLANATYLGKETVDTHATHVWTKSEGFIKYWADTRSGLPVSIPVCQHCDRIKDLAKEILQSCAAELERGLSDVMSTVETI